MNITKIRREFLRAISRGGPLPETVASSRIVRQLRVAGLWTYGGKDVERILTAQGWQALNEPYPEGYTPSPWVLSIVGQVYRSFTALEYNEAREYLCTGYDPSCGFWMHDLRSSNRRNISERAIDRTYHKVHNPVFCTTKQATGMPHVSHAYVYHNNRVVVACLHGHKACHGKTAEYYANKCANRLLKRYKQKMKQGTTT